MNIQQLKRDIFDPDHPERQYKAAYQMRYIQNDPEAVRILFGACYEAKDPKLQQEAVRSLGVLRPDRALETFIKSTHNPNAEKRRRAYYHLGTLGNPKASDVVLNGLNDPDERVRRAAAISAGRLGSDYRAINALKKLLNGFEPATVQDAARKSVHFIEQIMNGRRKFNEKQSFNKVKDEKQSNEKRFNKTNYAPRSYTPKAF